MARALRPVMVGPRDTALRTARTCCDHLAGRLAVRIADAMVARGQLELAADGARSCPTVKRSCGPSASISTL